MATTDGAPRVALLARAGEACERIGSALREAGAEVVLVADPLQADPGEVRGAAPQAILVALDAAIEDAIERYEDVLADPGYMVIFEEAEQVALRTGWDAARWLRHLSAKLHRHDDVLPAGMEREDDLQPRPGPLPPPASRVDLEEAIVAVTGEAQQRADEVPRDAGLEGLVGLGDDADIAAAAVGDDAGFDDGAIVVPGRVVPELAPEDALDIDAVDPESVAFVSTDDASGDETPDLENLVLAVHGEDAAEPAFDGAAIEFESADAGGAAAELDELAFDPERFDRAGRADAAPAGIEEFLAARVVDADALPDADAEAAAGEFAAPEAAGAALAASPGFSGLSLADDEPVVVPASGGAATPAFDFDALGSGLSLADPDSYGHGKQQGAILIEAGIGGPDAVRQLLAAIPEGFAKAILIHLPLEGGRYDRLVKQMTRATALPVAVAEPGGRVEPGHVYFVPPGLGLKAVPPGWAFDAAAEFDAGSLPADDSAVLFLSGADAARVDAVSAAGWSGLVLGQTPDDGCYDPAAAQAAIAAGAGHDTPAALAARLLDRWPPPGHAPQPDPSGMLSP